MGIYIVKALESYPKVYFGKRTWQHTEKISRSFCKKKIQNDKHFTHWYKEPSVQKNP